MAAVLCHWEKLSMKNTKALIYLFHLLPSLCSKLLQYYVFTFNTIKYLSKPLNINLQRSMSVCYTFRLFSIFNFCSGFYSFFLPCRVLAQVSCEVVQPKQIRPNEGLLYINVEMNPMAAPHIEANRQTDLGVHLNRILEKTYKDSKCIDLESLCIVVEEKVRFYTDMDCKTSRNALFMMKF